MIIPKLNKSLAVSPAMWLGLALALAAALGYILIAQGLLGVGDLQTDDAPVAIVYIAAAGYLIGGLLILLHRRGLWITGLIINSLVMWVFFNAYLARPAVMFSPGGVATKAAQILLEVALIAMIVMDWRGTSRTE